MILAKHGWVTDMLRLYMGAEFNYPFFNGQISNVYF